MWTVCGCIVLIRVCFGGGACVALCLVLTHPAINCVSTAAVCIGQIESNATGPFCFSPLGWASRPPHSHWSQPSFSFFLYTALRLSLTLFLSHSFPSLFCFIFLCVCVSLSWDIDRLVSGTRVGHSFTCCSFLGLASKWHMCICTILAPPPTLPHVSARKGHKRQRLCLYVRVGSDFRLLQTSWLWPVLRAGGWPSLPQPRTSILGPHVRGMIHVVNSSNK